ncbi:unnamed protein product [Cochlearia groenlandica]
MVKNGGTKRKIPIEKITNKEALRTAFTKRSYGLFSKASQLCLLSDAQIAVLATPPSAESNVSLFSFGHSSVEAVVSAFLTGQRLVPLSENEKSSREDIGVCMARSDLSLGFWWDDESLDKSENHEEVKEAIDSMSSLLKNIKSFNSVDNNSHRDPLSSSPPRQ